MAFNMDLSYPLARDELANVLQKKVGHLEDALRTQSIHHNAIKRQNASLKKELEVLKNRVDYIYELWRRERVKGHTAGKKTKVKITPADLEWIRNTVGPKISKEEVVRMIRATRDA